MSDTKSFQATDDILSFDNWIHAISVLREKGFKDYTKMPIYQQAFDKKTKRNLVREAYDAAWKEHATAWGGLDEQKEMFEKAVNFMSGIMGEKNPFSNALLMWLKDHPEWLQPKAHQKEDGSWKSYDLMRADMLEAFGKAILDRHGELGFKQATSACYMDEGPHYLARTGDGSWRNLDEADLLAMLTKPDGPRIVMTSNHAFFEDLNADLNPIGESLEKLMRASVDDSDEHPNPNFHYKHIGADELGADDTVMVSLAHTRENNFLNLASLFRRLNDIEEHVDSPEEDQFEHIEDAGLHLTATLLRAMVKDPETIRVSYDANQRPSLFSREDTIELREDATDIVKKLVMYGFSQGGNRMRDAMRFLLHELHEENVIAPVEDKEAYIKALMGSFSVTVSSLNEKPMAQYYQDHGVRVTLMSNKHDQIAPQRPGHHLSTDPKIVVDGFEAAMGHHPDKMVDATINDRRAFSHVREAFAACAGKAAIHVMDYIDRDTAELVLTPNTTQREMDRSREYILEQLHQSEMPKAQISDITYNEKGEPVCYLRSPGLFSTEPLSILYKRFGEMFEQHVGKPVEIGFYVPHAIRAFKMQLDHNHAVGPLGELKGHAARLFNGDDPLTQVRPEWLEGFRDTLTEPYIGVARPGVNE